MHFSLFELSCFALAMRTVSARVGRETTTTTPCTCTKKCKGDLGKEGCNMYLVTGDKKCYQKCVTADFQTEVAQSYPGMKCGDTCPTGTTKIIISPYSVPKPPAPICTCATKCKIDGQEGCNMVMLLPNSKQCVKQCVPGMYQAYAQKEGGAKCGETCPSGTTLVTLPTNTSGGGTTKPSTAPICTCATKCKDANGQQGCTMVMVQPDKKTCVKKCVQDKYKAYYQYEGGFKCSETCPSGTTLVPVSPKPSP